jgi:gluconolactonase
VYRVDPDGSVHQIVTDAGKPNGVAVSPDEKTLYVVSNDDGRFDVLRTGTAPITKGAMALLRYDLDADGNASNRQVLVDYLPEDGPDGMIVDADGDLWVAVRDAKRPGIYACTPRGEEKAYIPTGVHFGRRPRRVAMLPSPAAHPDPPHSHSTCRRRSRSLSSGRAGPSYTTLPRSRT